MRQAILTGALAVAVLASLPGALRTPTGAQDANRATRIAELRTRITALETRVAALNAGAVLVPRDGT